MIIYARQRGFLILSAVILITAIAFMAATAAYIFTSNARSSANQQLNTQAFYVAQSGLHAGVNRYMGENTAQQLSCSAISGTPSLTNVTFGTGQFTVTATNFQPTPTTLPANITAGATTIRIASATGFATQNGAVVINGEMIDYVSIGTTGGACGGTAPCLLNATRGVAGTTAAAHNSGATVKQNFCRISSTAYVPSQANPIASRTVSQNAIKATSAIWAVGENFGGSGKIFQWTGSDWSQYNPGTVINEDLLGVYLVNENFGWAVGTTTTTAGCGSSHQGLFLRFDGTNWTRVCSSFVDTDLNDVHCVNENFCMAVGENRTFARWNGSAWQNQDNLGEVDNTGGDAVPNEDYRSVFCNSPQQCWAVGTRVGGGDGAIVEWDGNEWEESGGASLPNENYNTVFCVNENYCWLGGDDDAFGFYNGGSWSGAGINVNNGPGGQRNIYDIWCAAEDDCWAVAEDGSGIPSFYRWVSGTSTWVRQTSGISGVNNRDFNSLFCLAGNECYAVGDDASGAFYNGSNWSAINTGLVNNVDMYAVHGVQSTLQTNRVFGWRQTFN